MTIKHFNSPDALFDVAKGLILHQDEALKALSVLMYYHLKHLNASQELSDYAKLFGQAPTPIKQPPVFLVGKTGLGKTHLVKELCQLVGVNFVCVNCTHLSNSGYKGMNLADVGRMLAKSANAHKPLSHSVVFFDEFDKLFVGSSTGSNYVEFNRMLSAELLTLIEGTTPFPVKGDNDKDEIHIESKDMFFILGGSFGMHAQKATPAMGFLGKADSQDPLPQSQSTLTDFGLPDELAGRIGKVIVMADMTDAMMKDILLNSPTSPYRFLHGQLSLEHCTAELDNSVLDGLIAKQQDAIAKFGVRGLYQGFYDLPQIMEVLLDAPAHPYHHYVIKSEGFTKEHRPPPPPPEPAQEQHHFPRATEFFYDDDMPF